MIVWKGGDNQTEPVAVACEKPGYPNRDVHGDVMYENTHFSTREQAWDSIRRSAEAQVTLGADRLTDAQQALRIAEQRAAEAAQKMAAYIKARRAENKESNGGN
jgi:hypothetical protein